MRQGSCCGGGGRGTGATGGRLSGVVVLPPTRSQSIDFRLLMDLDIVSSNLLLRAIVVEDHLTSLIVPDPYAKRVVGVVACQIMKR